MPDIAIGIDDYEDSAPGNDKEKGAVGSPKVEEEANGVVASPQGPPETNEADHAAGDFAWTIATCLFNAHRNMLFCYTDFGNVPFARKTSIISDMKNFFDWGDNPKLDEGFLHRVAMIHHKHQMMEMENHGHFRTMVEALANPPPNWNMNKLKEAIQFRENDAFKESDEFKGHLEKNKGNRNKASVPTRTLEMTSLDSLKQKHMQEFINDQPLSDQGSLDPGDLSVVSTKSSVYGQGSGPSKQEFDQLKQSKAEMQRNLDKSHERENQLLQVLAEMQRSLYKSHERENQFTQTMQQIAQTMQKMGTMIDKLSESTCNLTPTIPCHDHNKEQNEKKGVIEHWFSLALGFAGGAVPTLLAIAACKFFLVANHEKLNMAEYQISIYISAILVVLAFAFSVLTILAIQFMPHDDILIKSTRILGALLLLTVILFAIGLVICIFL